LTKLKISGIIFPKKEKKMPTYEYQCEVCGHTFDKFQNITENPLTECPECGGIVKRLISGGAGLIFKGSGFYHTDYKNKTAKPSCGQTTTCCGKDSPCTDKQCH